MLEFAQRWGGWDDATAIRVLQEATGRDKQAAIFLIGHGDLPQAADLLAPLLESEDPAEKYAAACCLGLRMDDRALPVLAEYLLSDTPTDDQGELLAGVCDWFSFYYWRVVRQLATWGPLSFVPIFRAAFSKSGKRRNKRHRLGIITKQKML